VQGVLDFVAGGPCQFIPEICRFLETCFEASLADHHQKYNTGIARNTERKKVRLPGL